MGRPLTMAAALVAALANLAPTHRTMLLEHLGDGCEEDAGGARARR